MVRAPSTGRMRGWPSAVPTALVCAIVITGCSGGGGAATAPPTPSRDPGQVVASPSACARWSGLDDLFSVTTWLRQMIGDEVLFGAGTEQAKRDGLALVVYAGSLDGLVAQLPSQDALDLRASVTSVAASPYRKTPEQLNAAANDAQSLATRISALCF